jgi:methionyl-tRNA synthetase
VPAPRTADQGSQRLAELGDGLAVRVRDAIEHFAIHEALAAIWELIGAANKYVVAAAPWVLAKTLAAGDRAAGAIEAGERLATVLYTLVEALRLVAVFCEPFIPAAAERIAGQLGLDENWRNGPQRWGGYVAGTHVQPGPALFPKSRSETRIG